MENYGLLGPKHLRTFNNIERPSKVWSLWGQSNPHVLIKHSLTDSPTNSLNCSDLELHQMSLPDVLNLSREVKNKLFEKLHLMTLDDLDLILTFPHV